MQFANYSYVTTTIIILLDIVEKPSHHKRVKQCCFLSLAKIKPCAIASLLLIPYGSTIQLCHTQTIPSKCLLIGCVSLHSMVSISANQRSQYIARDSLDYGQLQKGAAHWCLADILSQCSHAYLKAMSALTACKCVWPCGYSNIPQRDICFNHIQMCVTMWLLIHT